jgi:hypothetical protein
MFSGKKRKFLFRCDECEMIVSVEFDDPEDLQKISDNKLVLECPCGGYCKVLRD